MGRPGVSGLSADFITGSAVFTKEQAELIKESANRSNGNSNHSLRTAIQAICMDYINIHMVLDVEDIDKVKVHGRSKSLCESLANISKQSLGDKTL